LLAEPGDSMAGQIAIDLARIFGFSAVALFDSRTGRIFFGGPEDLNMDRAILEQLMRDAAVSGMSRDEAETGLHVFAVRLGGKPIGSLAVRPARRSDAALESVANLVAITLERMRVQEESTHLDAARRSEALKSTMLDAIAHEFKTPLTSIKAAASTLVLNPAIGSRRVGELAGIVNEESDRLERLVTDAIHMAHIEGGSLTLQRAMSSSTELAGKAIDQCRSALDGHHVSVSVENGAEMIFGDASLIELALCQLLDNAAKYSANGSPIEVHVAPQEGGALIEVRDHGAGIPENEQNRIFDKFYRSPRSSATTSGTGMGLPIVREIAKAHGGQIWVESRPGEGSRFAIVLPAPDVEKDGVKVA
jgi:two-component system sensor histidine kinase KdpD